MISQNFVRKDMKKSVIFSVLRRDRYRKDDQHKKSYNGNFDLMLYRNPMEANGNEISLLGSQKLQELPMYQPFYKKPSKWTIQFRNYHQFVNKFDNFQLIQNHRRIWIYFTFKTPRISWCQNSWSPLFGDSVSGINFVNSFPFRDFKS